MRTTKATDWWWPGLSSTTPSTAVASPTPRDVVPAVGGSTQGTAATLYASRGTRGQTSGTKPADPGRSTTRAPTTLKTATPTGAEERDTRETTGPPTGRTNTGGTSTSTTTTHGPGNTTTAGVPGTGTRNGDQRPYPDWQDYDRRPSAFPSLDMPARNSRNLTPVAAQSDGDTSHQGKQHSDTSHQGKQHSDTSHQGKQHSDKGNTLGWGFQRQSPRLQTRNHRSKAHLPSCNQKGIPLKTVRSQLQRGQKNPATKMSEQRGGRRQRHRPLVTRQWKTHKLPIRKTTQQTGTLHSRTPPQLTATQSFMMPKSRLKIQREQRARVPDWKTPR